MNEMLNTIREFLTQDRMFSLIRAGAILVFGMIIARLLAGAVGRMAGKYVGEQHKVLFRKMAFYMMVCIVAASVLRELGFKLSVLLGAAGVLTVAVGFAAQTSASNIISGLFLLAEKPFQIGDTVKIGGTVGVVEAVELISVKLRTYQNHLVRIPNEEVNKSQVENMTYWPLRRVDIEVGVAYKENVDRVMDIIKELGQEMRQDPYFSQLILGDLEMLGVDEFADSQVIIKFRIKTLPIKQWEVSREFRRRVKNRFDKLGIEIPFPHRTLYWGTSEENDWMKALVRKG